MLDCWTRFLHDESLLTSFYSRGMTKFDLQACASTLFPAACFPHILCRATNMAECHGIRWRLRESQISSFSHDASTGPVRKVSAHADVYHQHELQGCDMRVYVRVMVQVCEWERIKGSFGRMVLPYHAT